MGDSSKTSSRSRWSRLRRPTAVFGLGSTVFAGLGVVDPNQPGRYPTCPFLLLTGHWCPGCGSLRAIHALAHLDVVTALARNPLAVIASAWLVAWFGWWVYRQWRDVPRTWVAPAWSLHLLALLLVVYGVARNLPGMVWLSPA